MASCGSCAGARVRVKIKVRVRVRVRVRLQHCHHHDHWITVRWPASQLTSFERLGYRWRARRVCGMVRQLCGSLCEHMHGAAAVGSLWHGAPAVVSIRMVQQLWSACSMAWRLQ